MERGRHRGNSRVVARRGRYGSAFCGSSGQSPRGGWLRRRPFAALLSDCLAPLLLRSGLWLPELLQPLVAASPYLFFGVMLGASLWYVARRLYGNAGGYVALALYCFSPAMIVNVAGTQKLGEMAAVWGAFGTIFTAIAVAHTLYAPREVVLWNWRRTWPFVSPSP